MKLRRRIGSVFLAFAMALSLIPSVAVSALAADLDEPVYRIRLMDRESWLDATFARAGVSQDGYAAEQYLIFYDGENAYTTGDISLGTSNSYSTEGYYDTEATGKSGKIIPNQIDRIAVGFTYNTQTVEAVFHRDEFSISYNEGTPGLDYAEISLTSTTVPSGNAVWFYAPLGTDTHNTLYDVVYTEANTSLGSNMPDDPPVSGDYVFISWWHEELNREFTADTIVKEDLVVYGEKVNQHNNPHFRVHNVDGDVYEKVAEKLNSSPEDIIITGMCLVGTGLDGEPTKGNPNYDGTVGSVVGANANQWHDGNTWFSICNIDFPEAAEQGWNHKVLPDTLQGIELYGTLNGEEFSPIMLNRNELDLHVNNDTWIDVYLRDTSDSPGPGPDEPGEAQLTVEKTVAIDGEEVSTASVGDTLEYTITVTNSGDAAAEDVKVWDSMWGNPGNAVIIDDDTTATSVESGYCEITVPANDQVIIYYTYEVTAEDAGKDRVNNVWIGAKDEDNPDATVTVTVDEEQPEEPDAPGEGDIPGILGADSAILVDCVSDETHANKDKVYNLWPDGSDDKNRYDVGNVTGSGDGMFTCTVTILPDVYVDQYNKDTGLNHWLVDEDAKSEITLTWDAEDETWTAPVLAEGEYRATFEVTCKPDAPAEEDIPTILGGENAVLVKCVSNAGHELTQKYYNLVANDTENIRYEVGDVVVNEDGTITCTVTILPGVYVARYNGEEDLGAIQHKLVTEEAQTVTLSWTETDGWTAPAKEDNTPWAVFNVECAPTDPTTEDLNTLFPNGVQVDCIPQNVHSYRDYDLADETYTTNVEWKDGQWTCTVTVTGESYVTQYAQNIGWPHTANNATRSVTLVWENGAWTKTTDNNVMVVFDVTCQTPDAPTDDQMKDLFKVQIDCITSDKWGDQYEHQNKDYAPIEGSYTLGNATANADGTWNLVVTVKAEKYVEQYSVDRNEAHELADKYTEKTVTLVYQDGAWTKPGDNIAFAFDVKCNPTYDLVYHGCGGETENGKDTVSSTFSYFGNATIKNNPFLRDGYVFKGWALTDGGNVVYMGGDDVIFNDQTFPGLSTAKKAELYAVWALAAPDADDIASLGIKVVIDCIDNVGHEDETYDLLDNRVTGSSDVYTLGPVDQDTETCKLTIFATEYVKAYGEEENIQARHKLADENVWQQTIELKWIDGKWTADTPKVTFNVTGDKEDDLNEPAVVNYTVNYFYDGEQNKDASYTGWGRAGDVVKQYIDKSSDGYTLDKVTGVPLTLAVDGKNIINVYYATDKWNAETNDPTTGDGIPDYKQVLIAYTTDGNGTVTPTTQVKTLEANADGKYVGTVNVSSTANANADYAFAFWMGPNDSTFWSKDLNATLLVEGGKTYTYTATFGTDLIGPEDPTGEDPDKPGDGIPDKYQVVVKYVADTGGKITGKQVEVLTITVDGHYSTVGDVTATGSQAAASHNWDFSRWVAPNGGVASWHPTLGQQTIENAEGGKTYVFTAHFRYDPYIPPVVDPDPDDPTPPVDPDKPQLNTEDHYAYIVGYPDGTVRPEGDITRAEVATIFFRLLTDESRDEFWSQTNDYTDVDADAWYNNAVSTLSNAGILNGYEDGTFQPDGNITRAEFATITARFFEATYEGEDLFSDIAGHWAADYINQAANAGIVNGYPDGTFRPQQNITRAEAMTMVNRTIDRHPDAEHFLDGMITWSDNHEDAWYYEQVQEATNSHEYTMNTDDEQNPYEIWTELLPVRDWAQLEKEWSDAHSGHSGGDVV